jgi:hypothetical protein
MATAGSPSPGSSRINCIGLARQMDVRNEDTVPFSVFVAAMMPLDNPRSGEV